jgi:hypothetical protein
MERTITRHPETPTLVGAMAAAAARSVGRRIGAALAVQGVQIIRKLAQAQG